MAAESPRSSGVLFSGLCLCLATRLLRYGHRLATNLPSLSLSWALIVFTFYLAAFACIVFAFVQQWPTVAQNWSRPIDAIASRIPKSVIRYGGLAAMGLIVGKQIYIHATAPSVGTDAVMFSRYANELVRAGINPYSVDMAAVYDRYGASLDWATFRIDGSFVTVLSYPALSFLAFLPQSALGLQSYELTTLLVLGIGLFLLVWMSPPRLAWLPVLMVSADWDVVAFSAGGIFDALWLLPLLLAMLAYHGGRVAGAGVLFGVACCVKQTPWLAAPFLLLFVTLAEDNKRVGARQSLRFACGAVAAFLVVNAPFIATDPAGWLRGSLTPVGGGIPLVELGAGPVLLNIIGVTALPKVFFSVLALAAMALGAVLYIHAYARIRWLAWCAPMFVLWLNHRSLQNYFVFFVPVAYLGLLLRTDVKPSLRLPRRLPLFAVASAVVIVGTAAFVLRHRTSLNVIAEITDARDHDDLGVAATLALRVSNQTKESIEPMFAMVHAKHTVPMAWRIIEGPRSLAPGATAAFVITPPTGVNGLTTFEESIHLRVYATGSERWSSLRLPTLKQFDSDPAAHRVRNPGFVAWSKRPDSPLPAEWWNAGERAHGALETDVSAVADHGVHVAIRGDANGHFTFTGLRQPLETPIDGLRFTATAEDVAVPHESALPEHAAGFELRTRRKRIFVFLADVEGMRVVNYEEHGRDERIIYLPAHAGERVTYDLPLRWIFGEGYYQAFLNPKDLSLWVYAVIRGNGMHAGMTVHELRALRE